jgi:hypothetical protein
MKERRALGRLGRVACWGAAWDDDDDMTEEIIG